MQILNKRASTDGYKNGRFGNHLRQWDTPGEAIRAAGESAWYALRYRGPGANGPCLYNLSMDRLVIGWELMLKEHPVNHLYVSEMAPDHKLSFQGEICEYAPVGGYALHYSTMPFPQRVALTNHRLYYHGPGAKLLCKQFMDDSSYANMLFLLDNYPQHTIEFSCFKTRLGNLRWNTIFWEVRNF